MKLTPYHRGLRWMLWLLPALLAVTGGIAWYKNRSSDWRAPAAKIRPWGAYSGLSNPASFDSEGWTGTPQDFAIDTLPQSLETWPPKKPFPPSIGRFYKTEDDDGTEVEQVSLTWLGEFFHPDAREDLILGLPNSDGGKDEARICCAAQSLRYRVGPNEWVGTKEGRLAYHWNRGERLDVPEELIKVPRLTTSDKNHTNLTLLFSTANLGPFRCNDVDLYDARTGTKLGIKWRTRIKIEHEDDTYFRILTPLPIWHDTPILMKMDFLMGDPVTGMLPLDPGKQLLVGDRLRLRVVQAKSGLLYGHYPEGVEASDAFTALFLAQKDMRPEFVIRHPSTGKWMREDEGHSRFTIVLKNAEYNRYIFTQMQGVEPPKMLEVGFYPNRFRVWMRLPTIEGMPNGRDVEDLFDVRIPFVDRENLTKHRLVRLLKGATELDTTNSDYLGSQKGSAGEVFRNVTPRELLENLSRKPNLKVTVDEDEMQLIIRKKINWFEGLKSWLGGMTEVGAERLRQFLPWMSCWRFFKPQI